MNNGSHSSSFYEGSYHYRERDVRSRMPTSSRWKSKWALNSSRYAGPQSLTALLVTRPGGSPAWRETGKRKHRGFTVHVVSIGKDLRACVSPYHVQVAGLSIIRLC